MLNYKQDYTTTQKQYKKIETNDLSSFVFGKVPPQVAALEEAVLGALMLDKEAFDIVSQIIKTESFYSDAHKEIYKAILELGQSYKPIDLLTVAEQMKKNGTIEAIGGTYYLVELTNRVASSANIEYHARIIQQKWVQRELIRLSTTIIRDAYEDTADVFDLCDFLQQSAIEITSNVTQQTVSMSEHFKQVTSKLARKYTEGLSGMTSGLKDVDKITGGWQKKDLIILAARPSMGKSNLMLHYALQAALTGKATLIFSLEMSAEQLLIRLAASLTEIEYNRIRDNKLSEKEIQSVGEAYAMLSKLPLEIDDTPALSIYQAMSKARAFKMKWLQKGVELGLILADYLQLFTAQTGNKNGNREQEIARISRGMKTIAKQNDVPFIALSQLSRSVETRGGSKKPQLSDLRESGSIEQDADIVQMLYRAEYYNILEDENMNSTKNTMEILTVKNRNGALGDVKTRTKFEFSKIEDYEADNYYTVQNENNIITQKGNIDSDTPF